MLGIQQSLAKTLPGRSPGRPALFYRLRVFSCDDVLRRQAELDVQTLEEVRGEPLAAARRTAIVTAQVAAHSCLDS